jgi:hypothetical protein
MAAKIARLRRTSRRAGRPTTAVTVSLTAPVAFDAVAAPAGAPRPVLRGPPDAVAADLRRYQALGVQNFNLNLPGRSLGEQLEAMERFAHEVMPLLPGEADRLDAGGQ